MNSAVYTNISSRGKPRLMLHSCCGPCSTSVIERLIENYNLTVFFYNPNIVNGEEYKRRLEAQEKVINWFKNHIDRGAGLELIDGRYSKEEFSLKTKGLESAPEGSIRCNTCFGLRLDKTAERAVERNFDYFTTTLTVSPHKNREIINFLGESIGKERGIDFLQRDFKKQDGFRRSVELSAEIGIYRQNFCGCRFSVWDIKKNLGT